jgi:hypothetical protein
MKRAVIVAAAMFAASAAHAEDTKISMERVASLYTALTATFGPSQMGSPALKLSATTAFAIAVDMDRLKPLVDNYNAVVKQKSDEIAKDHPEDLVAPGVSRFKPGSASDSAVTEAMTPLWKSDQDIDLMRIKLADLNIGVDPTKNNNISPAVLAAMLPIVDQ